MSEPDDSFFRKISDYFVLRRGRGVVLASSDHARLMEWRQRGAHYLDVMEAIDEAFRKAREVPASLAAVAPYLRLPKTGGEIEFAELFEEPDASRPSDSAADEDADEAANTLLQVPLEALRAWSECSTLASVVRIAASELEQELRVLAESDAGVDSQTLSILDDALALSIFRALPDDVQRGIERAAFDAQPRRPRVDPRDNPGRLRDELRGAGLYPEQDLADILARSLASR